MPSTFRLPFAALAFVVAACTEPAAAPALSELTISLASSPTTPAGAVTALKLKVATQDGRVGAGRVVTTDLPSLTPSSVIVDASGMASFQWDPGTLAGTANVVFAVKDAAGGPAGPRRSVELTVTAGPPVAPALRDSAVQLGVNDSTGQVGFVDAYGNVVSTLATISSDNPAVVSIGANGVLHGLAPGSARLTFTFPSKQIVLMARVQRYAVERIGAPQQLVRMVGVYPSLSAITAARSILRYDGTAWRAAGAEPTALSLSGMAWNVSGSAITGTASNGNVVTFAGPTSSMPSRLLVAFDETLFAVVGDTIYRRGATSWTAFGAARADMLAASGTEAFTLSASTAGTSITAQGAQLAGGAWRQLSPSTVPQGPASGFMFTQSLAGPNAAYVMYRDTRLCATFGAGARYLFRADSGGVSLVAHQPARSTEKFCGVDEYNWFAFAVLPSNEPILGMEAGFVRVSSSGTSTFWLAPGRTASAIGVERGGRVLLSVQDQWGFALLVVRFLD